jgi:hypothetical protein
MGDWDGDGDGDNGRDERRLRGRGRIRGTLNWARRSSERRTGRGLYCTRCFRLAAIAGRSIFLRRPLKVVAHALPHCLSPAPPQGQCCWPLTRRPGHCRRPAAWQGPALPSCQLQPAQAKNSKGHSGPTNAPITAISISTGVIKSPTRRQPPFDHDWPACWVWLLT